MTVVSLYCKFPYLKRPSLYWEGELGYLRLDRWTEIPVDSCKNIDQHASVPNSYQPSWRKEYMILNQLFTQQNAQITSCK